MGFDTSLFANNDPQLASRIENLPIGFEGMESVKISWIDAKALIKDGSEYWKNLYMFVEMCTHGRENVPYYRFLQQMACDKGDFRSFNKLLRMINHFYYGEGYDSVRVVYYATIDAISRGK